MPHELSAARSHRSAAALAAPAQVRYFVLYDSGRICHYDDMEDGLPVGDRGLIDLSAIRTVEKVLGVPTFVMKGASKVYLFKLEPHDEVMMRTWIGAISQQLS